MKGVFLNISDMQKCFSTIAWMISTLTLAICSTASLGSILQNMYSCTHVIDIAHKHIFRNGSYFFFCNLFETLRPKGSFTIK